MESPRRDGEAQAAQSAQSSSIVIHYVSIRCRPSDFHRALLGRRARLPWPHCTQPRVRHQPPAAPCCALLSGAGVALPLAARASTAVVCLVCDFICAPDLVSPTGPGQRRGGWPGRGGLPDRYASGVGVPMGVLAAVVVARCRQTATSALCTKRSAHTARRASRRARASSVAVFPVYHRRLGADGTAARGARFISAARSVSRFNCGDKPDEAN